jgi:hypothetical protein
VTASSENASTPNHRSRRARLQRGRVPDALECRA